jgi:hypothetical protein
MAATDASELLARFAAGADDAQVCTPQGRALLRGAVRAYSAEMAAAGVAWPAIPAIGGDADNLRSVDMNVLVAFSAGFLEASDFQNAARSMIGELSFANWREVREMRRAAHLACAEVVEMQRATARFVLEQARYQQLAERARGGETHADRLRRQDRLLEHAAAQMNMSAAAVASRLRETQS